MLQPRIIPCLLVQDKGLVKTVQFKKPKYVGDPINAVRIFNDKQVDELCIFDIDATVKGEEPDFEMIAHWASECRMPLCYGGGIKTAEQARRIFESGVEKIALSSAAIENPSLITEIADQVGSQSVVVVLDVRKKTFGGYQLFTHGGKKKTGINPFDFAKKAQELGAGEIVLNDIDKDGTMTGYNLDLVEKLRVSHTLPFTILGGVGSFEHIKIVIQKFKIIGVGVGSFFVFRGIHKAVLINYPDPAEKRRLITEEG